MRLRTFRCNYGFHLAVATLVSTTAFAQPGNQLVRIVAPTAPGGLPDVVSRIIANDLSSNENWKVIVDNRPGALQSIALAEVLRQEPDGLTVFPLTVGAMATPALLPEKRIRLESDFAPVIKIATGSNVLVVNPSVPAKTISELVTLLKSVPSKLTYSSAPFGSPGHLLGGLFKLQSGTDPLLVPYAQAQQRVADLLNGTTHFAFYNTPAVVELIAAGKLRALAVTGPKRIAALKDVPTVAEQGLPGISFEDWIAFIVKSGAPRATVLQVNAAVNRTLARQGVRDALATLGYETAGGTPEDLQRLIADQAPYWAKFVRDAHIKMPQ